VYASHLRPRLPRHLAAALESKLQRTAAGYSPRSVSGVLDWLKERLLIPMSEWHALLAAVDRDHDLPGGDVASAVVDRAVAISPEGGITATAVCAVENVPRLCSVLERDIEEMTPTSIAPGGGPADGAMAALAELERRGVPDDGGNGHSLEALLADILGFYGPVEPDRLAGLLGIEPHRVRQALDGLAMEQMVVLDQLLEGAESIEVCDRENMERLLRMHRAASRPAFEPVGLDRLPLFLAQHQGLGISNASIDDLKTVIEPLFGWPAPVDLLETDLLPARIEPYQTAWLDALMNETELEWFGCGQRKIALTMAGERDLYAESSGREGGEDRAPLDDVFPHRFGRFSFSDLARHSAIDSSELYDLLWNRAWSGELSTDTFAPVRKAVEAGFHVESAAAMAGRGSRRRRPRFDRWVSDRPVAGVWFRLPPIRAPGDALEEEEDRRERVRVLLDRYGVLFRELVARELPRLRWGEVFRALRMLELAGEVFAGRFFTGVPGIQFASPRGLRRLQDGLPDDAVWWVNAMDPASPCGLGLELYPEALPRRVPGNHLVFHGRSSVVVSEGRGRRLSFRVSPDHPKLSEYMGFLKHLLTRAVKPLNAITVEEINDEPAGASPYRPAFEEVFHVTRTPTALRLGRRY
jgi:ATP-dependent Lhr-like helicase